MICDSAVICRSVFFGLCVGELHFLLSCPTFCRKRPPRRGKGPAFPATAAKKPLTFLPVCGILFVWLVKHNRLGTL